MYALSVTHARIVYRTRAIRSVVYGRNAEYLPVSRIKMADYPNAIAHYTKNPNNSGASMVLSP